MCGAHLYVGRIHWGSEVKDIYEVAVRYAPEVALWLGGCALLALLVISMMDAFAKFEEKHTLDTENEYKRVLKVGEE